MAYWLEIHCDAQIKAATPTGRPSCFSHSGDSPGTLIASAGNVPGLLAVLAKSAKRGEWKRNTRTGKWTCPACQRVMREESHAEQ